MYGFVLGWLTDDPVDGFIFFNILSAITSIMASNAALESCESDEVDGLLLNVVVAAGEEDIVGCLTATLIGFSRSFKMECVREGVGVLGCSMELDSFSLTRLVVLCGEKSWSSLKGG